jgi:hypothetical protein
MDLSGIINLSFKVISDRRVLFITIAVILLWAALRYVGSVYRDRSSRRNRPINLGGRKSSAPRTDRERAAPVDKAGDGMID